MKAPMKGGLNERGNIIMMMKKENKKLNYYY
jgi:hypothetical protein